MVTATARRSDSRLQFGSDEEMFDRLMNSPQLGYDGGDTNLMRYVGNAPTNLIDPTGQHGVPQPDGTLGGPPLAAPGWQGPSWQPRPGDTIVPLPPRIENGKLIEGYEIIGADGTKRGPFETATNLLPAPDPPIVVHERPLVAGPTSSIPWWLRDYCNYGRPWSNPHAVDGFDSVLNGGKYVGWTFMIVGSGGTLLLGEGAVGSMTLTEVSSAMTGAAKSAVIVGTLTANQIQQLVQSSGDRVVVIFTRITQSPAANRVLSTSPDIRVCEQVRNGTMYVGRIPADLFQRLRYEGLIQELTVEMGGAQGTEYRIRSEAMPILQQYFEPL